MPTQDGPAAFDTAPPVPDVGHASAAATAADVASARRSLDRALLRGLGWTWISNWGTQIVSWLSTILVARLLLPSDYGIVAMATVFLGLARLMSEFGLGTVVLAMRDLTDRSVAQVNGLSMVFGVGAMLLSLLVALPLGHFFDSAELPMVVAVMSVGFVIAAARVVPYALLQRELRFDALARLEVLQALIMTATTLTLAAAGAGYWALALGPTAGQLAATVMNMRLRPVPFARPTREIAAAVRFSRNILVERVAGYGYSTADSLIIGRVLGDGPLGLYTLARALGAIAVDKVTGMTMRVTPAIFAAAQDDAPALRRYVYLITEGLAVATFPLCVGTALVAPEFVRVFLSAEWRDVTVPLQLVALQGVIPSITSIFPQILVVSGESSFVARNGVFAVLVVPVILLIGARWGVTGVAAAWFVCLPLVRGPLFFRTRRRLDLSLRSMARSLWPATSSAVVMTGAVVGVASITDGAVSDVVLFALKVAAGAAAYVGSLVLLHRRRVRDVVASLRAMRGAAAVPQATPDATVSPASPAPAP